MKNFGYQVSTDRQVDYDQNDHRILNFVLKGEPSFVVARKKLRWPC